MGYLKKFHEAIGANTEFKKIVASAGFIALFSTSIIDSICIEHKNETGESIHIDIWNKIQYVQNYFAGDLQDDVWYLIDAFEDFDSVRVEPYFDSDEFYIQAKEYIKNNAVPDEYIEKIGTTKEIWDAALKNI